MVIHIVVSIILLLLIKIRYLLFIGRRKLPDLIKIKFELLQ